jgi:hypothetical protein
MMRAGIARDCRLDVGANGSDHGCAAMPRPSRQQLPQPTGRAVDQERSPHADRINPRQQHVRRDAFDKYRRGHIVRNGGRQTHRAPGRQISLRGVGADGSAGIDYAVADLRRSDVGADRRHHPGRFDTRDRGRRQRVKSHALVDIDEVDADRGVANPDFVVLQRRKLEGCAFELVGAAGRLQSNDIGHGYVLLDLQAHFAAGREYAKFHIISFLM